MENVISTGSILLLPLSVKASLVLATKNSPNPAILSAAFWKEPKA